jgi:hypothetical protein
MKSSPSRWIQEKGQHPYSTNKNEQDATRYVTPPSVLPGYDIES